MTCAIEDAGFEIRDCIMWVYGSGFPKSHDVSKAIDKAAGAERKVVGYAPQFPDGTRGATYRGQSHASNRLSFTSHDVSTSGLRPIEEPATEAAKQWQGWGSALKPAVEPIVCARKPLDGTIADNVLRHGTGGINIDGCRVGTEVCDNYGRSAANASGRINAHSGFDGKAFAISERDGDYASPLGRWPANLIHDGSDEVVGLFPQSNGGVFPTDRGQNNVYGKMSGGSVRVGPMADFGSAARFFYCAKTSPSERGDNNHPTVKPLALMRYLCRLVTPSQGVVLDPFAGSGSTLVAARAEGFSAIGCELEAAHIDIIKRRLDLPIEREEEQPREEKQQDSKKTSTQLKLF